MSETQTASTDHNPRGPRRGRGGRGGQGRGRGRGSSGVGSHRNGSEQPDDDGQGGQTAEVQQRAPLMNPTTIPVTGASLEASGPVWDDNPGGARGGRRGRGRGGAASGQRSVVVSHRGRGRGRPGAAVDGPSRPSATGLSAVAPEFVPGQLVAPPR
jgi:hypothetical protein